MSKRFFVDSPIRAKKGEELLLEGSEAHHLIHVMRGSVGDQVVLFDGSGKEFRAKIRELRRRAVLFELLDSLEVDRELEISLTIAIALPKADRQRVLIEKLTEIGTTSVVPLITERSVADPKPNSIERLNRSVIEASKQCGRNRLMRIEPATKASDLFADHQRHGARFIASTSPATKMSLPSALAWAVAKDRPIDQNSNSGPIICAVGPEGGFTDQETDIAIQNGWQAITLGNRILRAETAAITIAATITQLINQ